MGITNNRRAALKKTIAGSLFLGAMPYFSFSKPIVKPLKMNQNFKHSVCRWTFNDLPLEALCKSIKSIGFNAIDLVGPEDWHILKEHGVESSMCNGAEISLEEGWNHTEFHDTLVKNYTTMIPKVAEAGYKNLICFSGNRKGMDDAEGLENSAKGLEKIMPLAQKHGIIIHMELLNSKVDHPDYMCDNTPWGVELCKRLASDNFRLLYDIYHMQVNEGNIIETIQENAVYFGHYHTAGVPGRNEIDDSQELNYPAIMKAIAATGFDGYVAQEFLPTNENKLASLQKAIAICEV